LEGTYSEKDSDANGIGVPVDLCKSFCIVNVEVVYDCEFHLCRERMPAGLKVHDGARGRGEEEEELKSLKH